MKGLLVKTKRSFILFLLHLNSKQIFFVLTDILPLSTLSLPWVPVLYFFPSCATEMLGCDNVTLTQGGFVSRGVSENNGL